MEFVAMTGHRTVPIVFDVRGSDPVFVGGSDNLEDYLIKQIQLFQELDGKPSGSMNITQRMIIDSRMAPQIISEE